MLVDLPKPDTIVLFQAYSKSDTPDKTGALYVFGDPKSPKMALLCAGFPDDQTVFLPFAKKLSENGILVGVMCLPGYDDRPDDGLPWQKHPREGFSFNEAAKTTRAASKALEGVSTFDKKPEFIAIFHDWGCIPGSMWTQQVEIEAKDKSNGNGNAGVLKPDKVVYFDVLIGPPSWASEDKIPESDIVQPDFFTKLTSVYQLVFGVTSFLYTYVSQYLGLAFFAFVFAILQTTGIVPLYPFDNVDFLYKGKNREIFRILSMTFMYRNILTREFLTTGKFPWDGLHEDWKSMPILYLYGKKKKAIFHDPVSVAMLEREDAQKRSLSKAVGVEEAGHFLYVQKEEECLKHVIDFFNAENTFVS